MRIGQQFVQVGDRRVLLRHAGRGPAVVLLHQSPQNSRALLPWFDLLAPRHAVFAPDTPGFGLSDPLALSEPTIADYAAALDRLLQVLGLDRVLLFGVHTGAAIAMQLALDRPWRVAGLVCDGLSLFDAGERQALLAHYLPPFEPSWDGTHLRWLFARLREQHLYFPWYDGRAATRMGYPLPSPARVHADVLDLLDAGDEYRKGYRAAFQCEQRSAAGALNVPTWFFYRRGDVLERHGERLPALPPGVRTQVLHDGAAELERRTVAAFDKTSARATSVDAGAAVATALSVTRRIVDGPRGPIGWHVAGLSAMAADEARSAGGADGELTLIVPDLGQPAAAAVEGTGAAVAAVPEWPGHGASRDGWPHTPTLPELADTLLQALDDLVAPRQAARVTVRGTGAGCTLAAELARRLGTRCHALALHQPMPLDEAERTCFLAGLPDPRPDAHGASLLAVWDWVRLAQLYWPWRTPDARAAIAADAPAPRRVQAQVREILRAGALHAGLWRAALDSDLCDLLRDAPRALQITCEANAENERLARRLTDPLGLQPQPAAAGTLRWARPPAV